jgi:N-methylhydantoinase B
MTMNTQVERAHCKPWGLDSGLEGTGNQVALRQGGQWKTDFPERQGAGGFAEKDDAFLIRGGGGGGYGNPLERAIEEVAEDAPGAMSIKAAAEHYGVVIDPDTLAADRAASGTLRAARRPAA